MARYNVAEQLALMAIGKQRALDFTQIAATILGAVIDPQVSKLVPSGGKLSQITLHTFSGTLVNTALQGSYNLEYLAAQLVSNILVNAATPGLEHGLSWLDGAVFQNRAAKLNLQTQVSIQGHEKQGNHATKDNVHRSTKVSKPAVSPDAFLRQMSIDELVVDYLETKTNFYNALSHEAYYESFIPSIDSGASGKISSSPTTHEKGFIDYCLAFNRAVEKSRDSLVNMIVHPLETVEGLGTLAFDGANAVTDITFGYSTQGSRARNSMRAAILNKTITTFEEGDSLTRFEMLSEVVSGTILGGAFGGPAAELVGEMAALASRAEVALSTSKFTLFTNKDVTFGGENAILRKSVLSNIAESKIAREASFFEIHSYVEEALSLDVRSDCIQQFFGLVRAISYLQKILHLTQKKPL